MKTGLLLATAFVALSTSVVVQEAPRAVSLFDGKTLEGWRTVVPERISWWSVVDGTITGGDGKKAPPKNTFLCTTGEFDDFEFRCLFRLSGDPETGLINSGIQYRSYFAKGTIVGYQADIGNGFWGDIYDEHRRNRPLVKGDLSTLKHILREDGWNSYIIRVKGSHHELYINGVKTCDYFEKDAKIPTRGVIGLQLHSGGKAKVEFKHLTITQL